MRPFYSFIRGHLADTLHTLEFNVDDLVESFTEEQEQALQLLTSLQELTFEDCLALHASLKGYIAFLLSGN